MPDLPLFLAAGRTSSALLRRVTAVITVVILTLTLTVVSPAARASAAPGTLPMHCLDPLEVPTPGHPLAKIGGAPQGLLLVFTAVIVLRIVIEAEMEKEDKVRESLRRMAYCFPGYNVVIAQPRDGSTQHMTGALFVTTVELSLTKYRVYIFKSGRFYQSGDLGYKNWAYSGYFTTSADGRTVDFSTPPIPERRTDWSSGAQGCQVSNRTLPSRDFYRGIFVGPLSGDQEPQSRNVRLLVDDVRECFPDYNVMVMHTEQPYEWESPPASLVWASSYTMQDIVTPGESTEVKTWGPGVGGRGHFDIYVFKSGTFRNNGDGSYINWAFYGNFTRSADGKTVTFTEPSQSDLTYNPTAGFADVDFGSYTAEFTSTAAGPYPGCDYTGSAPGDRGQLIQSLVSEYRRCFANTNILVVNSVDSFSFSFLSRLRHLSTVNGVSVFALDRGVVKNHGDGGWLNWGFGGEFDRIDDRTVEFARSTEPAIPPDPGGPGTGPGSGTAGPPGTIPSYGGGTPQPVLDGELLGNTTFDGTHKPWWVNAGMTQQLTGGAHCVDAPAKPKLWDVIVGHNSIYLPGGSTYTLSFDAKASAAVTPAVQVAPFDNPAKITYFYKSLSVGTAWKRYTYQFSTTYSDPYVLSQLQFRLGANASPYEFCMDNVSLTGNEYAYHAATGPAIKVNQLGYVTGGPKRATLMTSAALSQAWQLVSSGGSVAASGWTAPSGIDRSAASNVHVIDFSSVRATGNGFVLKAGAATSHPFTISATLYNSLRTDSMRLFYTNRSGIAIDGGIAGSAYARPAGHVGVSPNTGDTSVPCQAPASYVGNWTCGYRLNVTGGWYDAGDHGKYVVNGGIATAQLLSVWERACTACRSQIGDSTLSIPERGNGVPDVLDEARWNLEFMLKMQVPAGQPLAGMVHHKVHDESWTGPPMYPHVDPKPRSLHRPSTAATLNLAAAAAQGARVLRPYDAAFADRLTAAAERAYTAALANPTLYAPTADRSGGGPYADSDPTDEFYWAAAELWLTTRNNAYLTAVRSNLYHRGSVAFRQDGFYWGLTAALGYMDLARFGTGLSEQANMRLTIEGAANMLMGLQRTERFGQTYSPINGRYDWGSNSSMLNNQVVLATAYDLSGRREYADAALEGLDYLLGRNALGQSYVTGYGANPAKNQHSRWYAKSLDATSPNPPAGSVAGGPNSSLQDPLAASWLNGCAPQLCYVDNIEAWSVNEITINWNSALAWVSAFAAEIGAPLT